MEGGLVEFVVWAFEGVEFDDFVVDEVIVGDDVVFLFEFVECGVFN